MTHPLTPREKVVCVGCEGRPAPENNPCAVCGLTALASGSGSGDHAELARLAEAAQSATSTEEGSRYGEYAAIADVVGRERTDFWFCANPATVLAILAEIAALRTERDRIAEDLHNEVNYAAEQTVNASEAERKLAEAVDGERARGQVIINERDKWIVELIRERDAAKAILRDAVSAAVPDAMIFAGHPDAQRYSKALDGLRNWTDRARTFLSKEAERG